MDNNLHDEIAALAYELYEKSGRADGRDLENWSEAEKIVRARYAAKEHDEEIKSGSSEYMGVERRKHKRLVMKEIHKTVLPPSNIKVLNISADGVALETTKRLQMNEEYALEIKQRGNACRLKSRVIWAVLTRIEKKESGDVIAVYKAGIKFQQPLLGIKL